MLEIKLPETPEKNKSIETPVVVKPAPKNGVRTMNDLSPLEYEAMQIRINVETQKQLLIAKSEADLELANRYQEQQQGIIESKNSVGKNVGVAMKSFSLEREQEILDGQFVNFLYSKHIAKVRGGLRVLSISGYKIVFVENLVTVIPTSLYEQAMLFIEGLPSTSEIVKFTGEGDLTSDEKDLISRSSNNMFNFK